MAFPRSGKPRVPKGFENAYAEFQTIPNVGKATAEDLVRLRIRGVSDLARRDPMAMYIRLCAMDKARHDPCCIDVFMAIVDHARTGKSKPWWKYTPERKALLAATSESAPRRRSPR